MSDIFISYASEDRARAKVLAGALERQGWTVWWDRTIPAGRTFDEVIEEALDAAKSVIVLWSEKSVKSRWVRTEAQEGADRKILIPVLIEKVRIPLASRRIQSADLIGWDGSYTASSFQGLVGDIAALLGSPPKEEDKRQQAKAEPKREAEEKRKQFEAEAKHEAEEKRKQFEAEAKHEAEEKRKQFEAEVKRKAEEKRKQSEAEVKCKDVRASEQIGVIPTSEPTPDDSVQFTAYYPHAIQPNHQYSVYLYAHLQDDRGAIEDDIKRCKTKLGGKISKPKTAKRSAQIKLDTPITVVPECDDIEFHPDSLTKKWYGNWLRFGFDFQLTEDLRSELLFVRLSVQVYGVEISHIKCAIEVVEQVGQSVPVMTDPKNPLAAAKLGSRTATLYQNIFFSYSREDKSVAEAFRFAQIAVGNKVFMDTYSIRTGANWRATLAGAIDEADIFQLFWSKNSAASSNVRNEWQYALKYKCPRDRGIDFIRPVYWEEPIRPDPPTELSHLNFKYVPRLAVT